jgi:signal transduction histidine kinase
VSENVFQELKRYVGFQEAHERALRAFHPIAEGSFVRIADVFYRQILEHDGARQALQGGESKVGHLKVTLQKWMDELLLGPWDDAYYERRCRIGRVHVKIALPQHYMFGAMDILRCELTAIVEDALREDAAGRRGMLEAIAKILDLELAIMLHTYREDLLALQAGHFNEKLASMKTLTAGLSHEIRNPLNSARLQLEVLERRLRRLSPDLQPALLEPQTLVQDEIRRLEHILQDFLQFARPATLKPAPVPVTSLFAKVLDLLEEDADRRGIALERRIDTDVSIAGEEARLRQVLMNLTLNALDATPGGGWVRVSASATPESVVMAVEDSGAGVPPELRERIFEPFFTTKPAGSGLGLPMVHAIVTQHGGTVTVESAQGGGARFVLRLPRA